MKPKATTMQQRMGFSDPDLTSPKHDEIIFWLMRGKDKLARHIIPPEELTGFSYSDSIRDSVADSFKPQYESERLNHFGIASVIAEKPVMSGSFVVGFVDLVLRYEAKVFDLSRGPGGGIDAKWIQYRGMHAEYLIEVKPSIPSFGELLRQIRHYQAHCRNGERFFVCSPDTRFKEAIEQQGIGFIVAPQSL